MMTKGKTLQTKRNIEKAKRERIEDAQSVTLSTAIGSLQMELVSPERNFHCVFTHKHVHTHNHKTKHME